MFLRGKFSIFRSCVPFPQAIPSDEGSEGLFLSKSTPCWMRVHCKLQSVGNASNVAVQTYAEEKTLEAFCLIDNDCDKPTI